jgi:hypothetical protein
MFYKNVRNEVLVFLFSANFRSKCDDCTIGCILYSKWRDSIREFIRIYKNLRVGVRANLCEFVSACARICLLTNCKIYGKLYSGLKRTAMGCFEKLERFCGYFLRSRYSRRLHYSAVSDVRYAPCLKIGRQDLC